MLRYCPGDPPSTLLIIVTCSTLLILTIFYFAWSYIPQWQSHYRQWNDWMRRWRWFQPHLVCRWTGAPWRWICCQKVFIRISRPGTEGQQHTHKVEHNGTLTTRGRKPEPPGEFFILSPMWIQYLSVQGGYNQFGCLTSMRSNSSFAVYISLQIIS